MQSISIILLLIFISICSIIPASAEIWHDDFDTENPDAWRIVGNDDVWKVNDGFLRIDVNRDWAVQYDLYEFIAFPAPYRDFTINIKNFGGDKIRFGFCVGRSVFLILLMKIHFFMCFSQMKLEQDVLMAKGVAILFIVDYLGNLVNVGIQTF